MSTLTDSIGRVLAGRYRIESALGTGASAHVFCAWDVTLRRRVAVKVLHPALAGDAAFLRRFRAEAQAAAALTHHHVLAVYDWGEDESGPFLVLEFLAGGSLRDMLDEGHQLSVSQAVLVGIQAAEGLAFAHSRGFVHRDIKPANLLFDAEGRLRIADFGLARALSEAAVTEPAGTTVGTARYAAPEQATGNLVDGRADVYALALVLYEAVTGVVPFTADTTISTLMARVGARLPGHDALGPLGAVLQEAAAPNVDERLDAAQFARRLNGLTRALPAPRVLPLVGSPVNAPVVGGAGRTTDATEHGIRLPIDAPSEAALAGPTEAALAGPTEAALAGPTEAALAGPTEAVAGSAMATGAAAGDPSDIDTSQLLAVASAVGVATNSRTSVGGPIARFDVPETTGSASSAPLIHTPGARRKPFLRGRRWPWITAIVVLSVAIVAGGLAYGAIETKFFTPSHPVPDIEGLTIQQASAKLRPYHLDVTVAGHQSSVTIAAGSIIGESPKVGTSLKEGSDVSVIVSSGPPPVSVPSLANVSGDCTTITNVLAAAHLHADCKPQYSTQVPAGGVIDWNPKGHAPEFSTIIVLISQGPPIITYPSLSGITTCTGVQSAFQAVNLTASCTTGYSSTVPSGGLVSENPPNSAPQGSTVNVVLSKGPQPVAVPQIPPSGKLSDEISALNEAGLVAGNIYGPASGRVFQTSPSPGEMVPPGTAVNIYTL